MARVRERHGVREYRILVNSAVVEDKFERESDLSYMYICGHILYYYCLLGNTRGT